MSERSESNGPRGGGAGGEQKGAVLLSSVAFTSAACPERAQRVEGCLTPYTPPEKIPPLPRFPPIPLRIYDPSARHVVPLENPTRIPTPESRLTCDTPPYITEGFTFMATSRPLHCTGGMDRSPSWRLASATTAEPHAGLPRRTLSRDAKAHRRG